MIAMTTTEQSGPPPWTSGALMGSPSSSHTGEGLSVSEKDAKKQYSRMLYLRKREQKILQAKKYYIANKDRLYAIKKEAVKLNIAAVRQYAREYYSRRNEKINEQRRKQYREQEEIRVKKMEYRAKNRQTIMLFLSEYRKSHKERISELNKKWRKENASYCAEYTHRRRSISKGSACKESASIILWIKTWKAKKSVRCYWCCNIFSPKECHLDHILPISKGGEHSSGNLCVSCARCNQHKHAKTLSDWNKEIERPVLL